MSYGDELLVKALPDLRPHSQQGVKAEAYFEDVLRMI